MDSQTIKLVEMMYQIKLIKKLEFTQFLKSSHYTGSHLDAILNNLKYKLIYILQYSF